MSLIMKKYVLAIAFLLVAQDSAPDRRAVTNDSPQAPALNHSGIRVNLCPSVVMDVFPIYGRLRKYLDLQVSRCDGAGPYW